MSEPLIQIKPFPKDKDTLEGTWPSFSTTLGENGRQLTRQVLRTLQINVGKLCNQTCRHCHVEAGPRRKELMTWETVQRVVELLDLPGGDLLETVDITGGAPELNPHFRHLVSSAQQRDLHVMDRCNLTVLFEPGQEDTAVFLRDHGVEIVASLPCYSRENVEQQRGKGVFDTSIRALQLLNSLGYGREQSLALNLVYNPVGPFLPPEQEELQGDYKERLQQDFGIEFNQLYTITNMPIKRFLYDLKHDDELDEYMELLISNFNPHTVEGLMCRELVSIGWEGTVADCDFNLMLDIPADNRQRTIWDIESLEEFCYGGIAVADHCYGCTAGAGSSCGGQLE